ncbi:MAG: 23S rRNA (pseudouridine(1915)-N(3))-methyltransferase RlmH [Gammaproteobacteria bacterium]|nr:23S rRNA (pseudouridine(1915)-N(3))-methyltransferase RlmH [Gammaproteobacteria bacterium]MBV9696524.1 23S rRNA (pseudouridine(1915)-N(3))-methyltransferase RlmH [Gammaproteobacteria bacterium]
MRVRVLAVGTRMPDWVRAGCTEYLSRIAGPLSLSLEPIESANRGGPAAQARAAQVEGERLLRALRPQEFVVALDERGREFATRELAAWLGERRQAGSDVALLIGGPDGLAEAVLARCELRWSLSRLTLPHALVRIVLLEQLYRAHTLLAGHPYHRDG